MGPVTKHSTLFSLNAQQTEWSSGTPDWQFSDLSSIILLSLLRMHRSITCFSKQPSSNSFWEHTKCSMSILSQVGICVPRSPNSSHDKNISSLEDILYLQRHIKVTFVTTFIEKKIFLLLTSSTLDTLSVMIYSGEKNSYLLNAGHTW